MPSITRVPFYSATRSSQVRLGSSSHTGAAAPNENLCHCPFKHVHGCQDGINGRGFAKGSVLKHLYDRHLNSDEKRSFCRDLTASSLDVYLAWENVLSCL